MDPNKLPGAMPVEEEPLNDKLSSGEKKEIVEEPRNEFQIETPEDEEGHLTRKQKLILAGCFCILVFAGIIGLILAGKSGGKAINPDNSDKAPETPAPIDEPDLGWNRFFDSRFAFSIEAPEIANVISDQEEMKSLGFFPTCNNETGAICVHFPERMFRNTNFESAGVSVNVNDLNKNQCIEKQNYEREFAGETVIGGITFYSFTAGEGATGHYSEGMDYRTFRNKVCYEITTRINTLNFDVYEEGTITRFTEEEKETVNRILEKIVQSFRFSE